MFVPEACALKKDHRWIFSLGLGPNELPSLKSYVLVNDATGAVYSPLGTSQKVILLKYANVSSRYPGHFLLPHESLFIMSRDSI